MMNTLATRMLALAVAIAASTSCGDLNRSGKSPAYLIIQSLAGSSGGAGSTTGPFRTPVLSDVVSDTGSTFNDVGQATIRAEFKNSVNPVSATSVNSITLTRYRVTFRRADGRNTPGTDVPFGFDGAITTTIAVGSTVPVLFDLVRHQNKEEPPLRNLERAGGLNIIATIAEVTFYGRDQAGNEVTTSGMLDVHFADFGG